MASQLTKGTTYADGDVVNAANLNDLVDEAIARIAGGLITEQTSANADPQDSVLISDFNDSGKLKRALVSTLPGAGTVTSVGLNVPTADFNLGGTNPIIATGTFNVTWKAKARNLFLAGPVTGGNTTPAFRAIAPEDTAGFIEVAAHTIDCTLGNVFRKQLSGGAGTTEALKLDNGIAGQRITVYLIQDAAPGDTDVTWDTVEPAGVVRWPGGTNHTMTVGGVGRTDIVNFLCMGSELYYGTFDKNFIP